MHHAEIVVKQHIIGSPMMLPSKTLAMLDQAFDVDITATDPPKSARAKIENCLAIDGVVEN